MVAGEHADSHLGHDFKQALVHGLPIGGDDFCRIEIGQGSVSVPAGGEFPHQVRTNGGSSKTDQAGKVVDIPAVRRIGDEGSTHPETGPNQAVVDGGYGEKHGDSRKGGVGAPVGQAKNGYAFFDGSSGLFSDFL